MCMLFVYIHCMKTGEIHIIHMVIHRKTPGKRLKTGLFHRFA